MSNQLTYKRNTGLQNPIPGLFSLHCVGSLKQGIFVITLAFKLLGRKLMGKLFFQLLSLLS